jgi:aryl-alcohol dehydrogenase-like predicted oxidoreductase
LAWVLTRDNIFTAIVGSRKPEQVQEFAKSTELKLNSNHLQRLTKASDQFPMVKKGH